MLQIFGLFFAVAFASAAPLVPYSYIHTSPLSTAVVHSERFNNAFAYNSIANHYVPAVSDKNLKLIVFVIYFFSSDATECLLLLLHISSS
jgi:hypothetical protein